MHALKYINNCLCHLAALVHSVFVHLFICQVGFRRLVLQIFSANVWRRRYLLPLCAAAICCRCVPPPFVATKVKFCALHYMIYCRLHLGSECFPVGGGSIINFQNIKSLLYLWGMRVGGGGIINFQIFKSLLYLWVWGGNLPLWAGVAWTAKTLSLCHALLGWGHLGCEYLVWVRGEICHSATLGWGLISCVYVWSL